MPPKRNTTERKLQAAVQDAEETLTSGGGHGIDLGLPACKPQWLDHIG